METEAKSRDDWTDIAVTDPAAMIFEDENAQLAAEADKDHNAQTIPHGTGIAAFKSVEGIQSVIAAELGVNINDSTELNAWLDAPVASNRGLMEVLHTYHHRVMIPEMLNQTQSLQDMLQALADEVITQHNELAWMKSQEREEQRRRSGMIMVTGNWPKEWSPEERIDFLEWMLYEVPAIKQEVDQWRGRWDTEDPQSWTGYQRGTIYWIILQTAPTTVKVGKFWSTITLLVFRDFQHRQAFRTRWEGAGKNPVLYDAQGKAVQGKHIKASPGVPAYQRKFEAPLRVLLDVLNNMDEYKGTTGTPAVITTLWTHLTIMAPQTAAEFDEDHEAVARMIIAEDCGSAYIKLLVTPELYGQLQTILPPTTTPGRERPAESLWERAWAKQFARVDEEDAAEEKAASIIRTASYNRGRGPKHWSSVLVRCEARPLPLPFYIEQAARIDFDWEAYCRKMNRPDKAGPKNEVAGQVSYGASSAPGPPQQQANGPYLDHSALTTLPSMQPYMVIEAIDALEKVVSDTEDLSFLAKCRNGDDKGNPFHPQLGGTWRALKYTPKTILGLITSADHPDGTAQYGPAYDQTLGRVMGGHPVPDGQKDHPTYNPENRTVNKAKAAPPAFKEQGPVPLAKARGVPGTGIPVPKGGTPSLLTPPPAAAAS